MPEYECTNAACSRAAGFNSTEALLFCPDCEELLRANYRDVADGARVRLQFKSQWYADDGTSVDFYMLRAPRRQPAESRGSDTQEFHVARHQCAPGPHSVAPESDPAAEPASGTTTTREGSRTCYSVRDLRPLAQPSQVLLVEPTSHEPPFDGAASTFPIQTDAFEVSILEEGCEVWFEARTSSPSGEEVTVESQATFQMQAYPWAKFDSFVNTVVSPGDVLYGPGWGAFDSSSTRWVVRAHSTHWGDRAPGGNVSNVRQERHPCFVCHTFVNFFLGYWFNFNGSYPTGFEDCIEFLDSNSPGYADYVEQLEYSGPRPMQRIWPPRIIFDDRYRLGVINVVVYRRNRRHAMILYKRNGELHRLAADGDNLNRDRRHNPPHSYDIFTRQPLRHQAVTPGWLSNRSNTDEPLPQTPGNADQTTHCEQTPVGTPPQAVQCCWLIWRLKPLQTDGRAPQTGGVADTNPVVTTLIKER